MKAYMYGLLATGFTFILATGTAFAIPVHTTLTAQVDFMNNQGFGGIDTGDVIKAEFWYNDGNMSHAPYTPNSDPLRHYTSEAQVLFGDTLTSWMNAYQVYQPSLLPSEYALVEPDGTELDEFFSVDNSNIFLSASYDLYGQGGNFYFELHYPAFGIQQQGTASFEAHVLTYNTQPIPEPSTLLLFSTFIVGIAFYRKKNLCNR